MGQRLEPFPTDLLLLRGPLVKGVLVLLFVIELAANVERREETTTRPQVASNMELA